MIELSEQQAQALKDAGAGAARLVDPQTQETFVLLPLDEYARLKAGDYDDSPSTRDELEALAWQSAGRGRLEEIGAAAWKRYWR